MANILYIYIIQVHKKAAIFLIKIDIFLYNWELQIKWGYGF